MHALRLHRLVVVAFAVLAAVPVTLASPPAAHGNPLRQDDEPTPEPVLECQECHLDIANLWSRSPHAHAFDDPVFEEQWSALGEPGDCLLCHTTNYQQTTGDFSAEGVECEACHGEGTTDHPPAPVPIRADTDYCGVCHTTTLGEWRLTGHAGADVGCSDCHDPHSQAALFAQPDDMCINCHKEDMGDYLEDLHVQKEIGCVDCHALVIPPEEIPQDGIVPTGHTFTITPATCVACHTDALHAGFSLPGYENGAAAAVAERIESPDADQEAPDVAASLVEAMRPERTIETLEAALASRNITTLFQGGVIGMTIGGSTAWIISRNIRRRAETEEGNDG